MMTVTYLVVSDSASLFYHHYSHLTLTFISSRRSDVVV